MRVHKRRRRGAGPKVQSGIATAHWTEAEGGPAWDKAGNDIVIPAQLPIAIYRHPKSSRVMVIRQIGANGDAIVQLAKHNLSHFVQSLLEAAGCTDVRITETPRS
jgi:hypothetical protein